jgi:hypothetical protein
MWTIYTQLQYNNIVPHILLDWITHYNMWQNGLLAYGSTAKFCFIPHMIQELAAFERQMMTGDNNDQNIDPTCRKHCLTMNKDGCPLALINYAPPLVLVL